MSIPNDIQQLLNHCHPNSNFKALKRLILELELSFEAAFTLLQLKQEGQRSYSIHILDILVLYTYIPISIDYYVIERSIYFNHIPIDGSTKDVFISELPLQDELSPMFMQHLEEIVEDRKIMSAQIEHLFHQLK